MHETIVDLTPDHQPVTCAKCDESMGVGAQAVFCPRCRTPHHLQCWIDRGGCARHGCRQRVSGELLPSRIDEPIRASKLPIWVYPVAALLVIALAAGLWLNAGRSAAERARTISVMLPASVDRALWESLMDQYSRRLAADGKEVLLTFVPELVPVMDGQSIEAGYYEQKLLIQMAAHDAPELVLLASGRVPLYISKGSLVAVDDIAAELRPILDPARLSQGEFEGSAYAIPHPGQDAYFAIPSTAKHVEAAKDLLAFVVTEFARQHGAET